MHFSLHSLPETQPDRSCYFRLHSDHATVYSPPYEDRRAALAGMEQLVIDLRKATSGSGYRFRKHAEGVGITLFGRSLPAVGNGIVFSDKEQGVITLEDWQAAALATTFRVLHYELETTEALRPESLKDLDLSVSDEGYAWREKGSSLLHVARKAGKVNIPGVGVHLSPTDGPCEPIFNAAAPFVASSFPLFHGRKKEVEEVHALTKQRNLLLVYGAERVGKTSLLQCGLANRLKEEEDHLIMIRKRADEDILVTLNKALRDNIQAKEGEDLQSISDPVQLAGLLNERTPQRNFLVFDQLDDLFRADIFDAERVSLFRFVRELTKESDTPFRVILSMREAFLAPLADCEHELPALLENRFRVLPLSQSSSVNATANLLDILKLGGKIDTDDPRAVSQKVCGQLVNDKGDVPVHCLQIYLHQLHQKSCRETESGPVPMTPELVDKAGPAPQLIDEFYQNRLGFLQSQLPEKGAPANPILEDQLAELEQARLRCGCGDNKKAAAAAAVVPAPLGIMAWLALAALPFGLFFLYSWWNPTEDTVALAACAEARESDRCADYVNYLCLGAEADEACVAEFEQLLEEKQCDVWQDYRQLQQNADCATYQDFLAKYRDSGICLDLVRASLVDWRCPIVRDTVRLTVRDTIVRQLAAPSTYGQLPRAGRGPSLPPCKQIGPYPFKKVGPLWIMTESVAGGPFGWEDALDACTARGFRLPCIGEIDFLIEKIYRDDPERAFSMLTGSNECALVNPNSTPGGRIEFWTATEANDATAWSYYFDLPSKTIGRQSATPKSARLPCLCVEKEASATGSGLPPCYQKSVDRVPGK